jgi:hypothetical protein
MLKTKKSFWELIKRAYFSVAWFYSHYSHNKTMSRVAQDIFTGLSPYTGVQTGPTPGNFGLSSNAALAGVPWTPNGGPGPANFLRNGRAPTSHGSISLKSFDFVQYVYLCPPWSDTSEKYIAPEMLCFAVKNVDPQDSSTIILTLAKVNQICKDCGMEFQNLLADNDANALKFNNLLTTYGEVAINTFHQLGKDGYANISSPEEAEKVDDLHKMATEDLFCWLTQFGIRSRINFVGSVINTNGSATMQDVEQSMFSDHYCQVNVCYAKRARIANVFGIADEITTGSKLWLTLRRKCKRTFKGLEFPYFQVVPGGSKMLDTPAETDRFYVDPSGRAVRGHVWRVGVVIVPGTSSPQPKQIENASNTSTLCNERTAFEDHGTLPTLIVSLGFKH